MDDSKREAEMKIKAELSDDSSSDSDASLHNMRCDTCELNFSSFNTYIDHVRGKKHKKTVEQAKLISKFMLSDEEKKHDSESDDEYRDSNEMYCEVCDKYMSGYIPYMTHVKGSLHAKNVKKQKLKAGMLGIPEVLDKENKEDSDDDDDVLQTVFARCSTCQKAFSGPEPFHMHLKSSAHKKKVQQSNMLEALKKKHQDGASNSDDEEDDFSKCTVCDKSFSGVVPYKIHMRSNVHKKNLEKMKLAEEIKEFFSTDENAYICKECSKKFTDPKNFKYHLTNNSHEKVKAKQALSEFLTSNPEIVFLTSFGYDDSNEKNDTDSSDEVYFLVCKLCHVSFSGPESAENHVKSQRHISLKKEKKMFKTVKVNKNDVNDSPHDKNEVNDSPDDKNEVFRNNDTLHEEKKRAKDENLSNGRTSQSRKNRLPSEDDFEMV